MTNPSISRRHMVVTNDSIFDRFRRAVGGVNLELGGIELLDELRNGGCHAFARGIVASASVKGVAGLRPELPSLSGKRCKHDVQFA